MSGDSKKLQPIIIKKIKKGGHGAHGGPKGARGGLASTGVQHGG